MQVGVVLHYQLCLLVWCLTIGSAAGVVPHSQPCLLAWCLTIGHACWSNATAVTFLLVECRCKKDIYKSGATLTEVPFHQTCLLIPCHSQICLLVQGNSIRHACWVHLFRYACLQSAVLSCKASGLLQIHQTFFQVRCRYHGFVKFVGYHPGRHLEYIKSWVMHE